MIFIRSFFCGLGGWFIGYGGYGLIRRGQDTIGRDLAFFIIGGLILVAVGLSYIVEDQ